MKILAFEYNNHPILGNLRLDLVNHATGLPFDNIVLAGENGVVKSTILRTLNSFLCTGQIAPFKEIAYITSEGNFKAIPDNTSPIESFHIWVNLIDNTQEKIHRNNNNNNDREKNASRRKRSEILR